MQRFIIFLFLLCAGYSHAQYGINCEVRQLKLNAFNPGLEYEMALGVNSTLDIRAAWQLALEPAALEPMDELVFFPALTVQNRYYHNFNGRQRRGRDIYGNSGNYLAPTVALFAPGERVVEGEMVKDFHGLGGLGYGVQRSYNSGLSFSVDVGAGYYVGPFMGTVLPVANLSIGWIINEKRWCVGR
ncbi:hypothetical protein [Flagellimonas myxillae]|uniref:hypothetical protein n=1 Tax=Flagellimonas myxillae TaxID=2942214 RepID=UPI00201F65BF|nr:hypothetical protein [Muricauda myxillae]MCL6265098.1 hypothetical protein [Muricauda myxillae]